MFWLVGAGDRGGGEAIRVRTRTRMARYDRVTGPRPVGRDAMVPVSGSAPAGPFGDGGGPGPVRGISSTGKAATTSATHSISRPFVYPASLGRLSGRRSAVTTPAISAATIDPPAVRMLAFMPVRVFGRV